MPAHVTRIGGFRRWLQRAAADRTIELRGGTAIITDLEEVYSPDMVAEVAERMMFLDGMKWSLAYATYRNQLYVSLRVKDRRMNAGRLIRDESDRGVLMLCDPRLVGKAYGRQILRSLPPMKVTRELSKVRSFLGPHPRCGHG